MIKRITKYVPKILLLDTLILILVFALIQGSLCILEMTFRNWFLFAFSLFTVIGVVAGIIQLLLKLKRKSLRIALICVFSVIVIAISIVATPITLFAFASEEHVVERDGDRYLARVIGWLDTYVYYYEYKNFIVQGRNIRIAEWYGNGGFDPLAGNHEYSPRRIIYYDKSGNIIDIIENDNKK